MLLYKQLVKTINSDNGKEFTKHQEIAQKLETDFYFIDNKNINMIISKLNNRPRKLLGYKTPNEVFLTSFKPNIALIS